MTAREGPAAEPDLVLVADIGGTHARFSLARRGARPGPPTVWLTGLHASLEAALDAFLAQEGRPALAAAAICAAGPVEGRGDAARIAMTNAPWVIEARRVARAIKAPAVLVNDFTAVALALPHFGPGDVEAIGGTDPDPLAPAGVLGPGTGLGVAGLVPVAEGAGGVAAGMAAGAAVTGHLPITGEGGHVSLAPENEREISILFQLMQSFGHVSAERVLSGPGMENLYAALGALEGAPEIGRPTAMDITRMAREGSSPLARETVEVFTGFLGSVAGDLALTLGAKGGIYLAGGILPRWGPLFDRRLFRRRFEAKGRFRAYLAPIPAFLITVPDPALIGLADLAWQHARGAAGQDAG